jgi:hypothetical protein
VTQPRLVVVPIQPWIVWRGAAAGCRGGVGRRELARGQIRRPVGVRLARRGGGGDGETGSTLSASAPSCLAIGPKGKMTSRGLFLRPRPRALVL